jgi:hypothetical protein
MSAHRGTPASRRPAGMACLALLLLLLVPAFARAGLRPDLEGTIGSSFAVLGSPDDGGTSGSLSLLWPVAGGLRFGVMVHADDAGSVLSQEFDTDSARVTIETSHRMAMGASWRLDVERRWRRLRPFASATLGWSRVSDDVRGKIYSHVGSVGFSLGGGARVAVSPHVACGAFVRYHRLFNDREGRFVSAGLDLYWR